MMGTISFYFTSLRLGNVSTSSKLLYHGVTEISKRATCGTHAQSSFETLPQNENATRISTHEPHSETDAHWRQIHSPDHPSLSQLQCLFADQHLSFSVQALTVNICPAWSGTQHRRLAASNLWLIRLCIRFFRVPASTIESHRQNSCVCHTASSLQPIEIYVKNQAYRNLSNLRFLFLGAAETFSECQWPFFPVDQ